MIIGMCRRVFWVGHFQSFVNLLSMPSNVYCRSLASLSHPSEDRTLPDRIPNFYEHKRIPQKVHNPLNVGPNARYVCNVYNQDGDGLIDWCLTPTFVIYSYIVT